MNRRHFLGSWLPLSLMSLVSLLSFGQATEEKTASRKFGLLQSIKITLAQDPNIALEKELLRQSQGRLQNQTGAFDYQLSMSANGGEDKTPLAAGGAQEALSTGNFVYSGGISKLFRSGLTMDAGILVNRSDNDTPGATTKNNGEVRLDLGYPLLNGRGRDNVTAGEVAASLDHESSRLEYRHAVSFRILVTVNAYWDYLTAQKSLQIARESEIRAKDLVADTTTLVDADEMPRNELLQLHSDLATQRATRIAAENGVFQARQNLGLIMGLKPAMIGVLPPPSTDFPAIEKMEPPKRETASTLFEKALQERADYSAAKFRQQASGVELKAAENNLKPNLDLNLNMSYDSLREGGRLEHVFAALVDRVPGPSYALSLRYRFPVRNNVARGRFLQSHAAHRQNHILVDDLGRTIYVQVALALENLRSSFEALKASQEAIGFAEQALRHEQKKFRLGFSTLVDVINFQDRLTRVHQTRINNQRQLMRNLAELRFQIGSFYLDEENLDRITLEPFTSVPGR